MCRQSSAESCVERDAVEDARIADDGVESSEGVDRGVDDGLAALGAVDRIVRGDRPSARLLDLVDHLIGDAACPTPSPCMVPPRSLTTTAAPRRANSRAYSRPSPRPAPVTIATWPSKSITLRSLLIRRRPVAVVG